MIMTHCHITYWEWRSQKTRDAVPYIFFGDCQEQANTTVIYYHLVGAIKHRDPLWGSDTHFVVWEGVNSNEEKPDMFRKVCNPSVVWRRELQ